MTRPERQPSPFPGLKKMVEWESFDRERCVPVDPRTRFLCPGCEAHPLLFFVRGARGPIDACVYVNEHQAMERYMRVATAKHGTRLRFLGERFDVDFDPSWESGWAAERIGWVGELQKHDYDHRVEVATQEIWVNFSATCWELAPGAPLGPLGGPGEHSVDRSAWASGGSWQLETMLREGVRLQKRLRATPMEALRLARVDLECWLIQDREWQAKFERERKERALRGETPWR